MPSRPTTSRRSRRPPPRVAPPGAAGLTVEVANRQRLVAVDDRWLAGIVRRATAALGCAEGEIGVAVVDDAGIAALHRRWMGLADPTDVITFDLAEPGTAGLRGDIAVSAETARRVARLLGWPTRHELAYYVVHGLLHLAGEDDLDPVARRRMRARERRVMARIGLPSPPHRRPAAHPGDTPCSRPRGDR